MTGQMPRPARRAPGYQSQGHYEQHKAHRTFGLFDFLEKGYGSAEQKERYRNAGSYVEWTDTLHARNLASQ